MSFNDEKTMFQNAKMLNNHTEGQRCHEKSVSKSHIERKVTRKRKFEVLTLL